MSGIPVEVVRKDIKNLHVGVYPPNGGVRVAAPVRLGDEAVRVAIVSRLPWILRQRRGFDRQERQSKREMVTGESHYVGGQRYRLQVTERDQAPSVRLASRTIELLVRPGTNRDRREAFLHNWYRQRLRERIPALVARWEPRVGVRLRQVCIRRMKTRWGSCNIAAQRVWINLELAKKPVACLEYILVHEMVHLLERHHTDGFRERLNRLMPQWRLLRDELNRAPLAHEEWSY